jgi:hypothetical protein
VLDGHYCLLHAPSTQGDARRSCLRSQCRRKERAVEVERPVGRLNTTVEIFSVRMAKNLDAATEILR